MPDGLSMADLTARARVGTLKRNGQAAMDDPMERALADDRRLQANAITRRSVRELEAEALRAEAQGEQARLDLLRAEIDRAKLEQEKAKMQGPNSGSGMEEFLFGEVQELRGSLDQLKQSITHAQMAQLQEQLNQLSSELAQTRQSDNGSLGRIKDQLQEAQALVALVTPNLTATRDDNPALQAYGLRIEAERDRRREEAELRREESQGKLALERELRDRELRIQEEHYSRVDRFMSDTAPKGLELIKAALETWGQNRGAAVANTPAAESPPAPRPLVMAPGIQAIQCPQCRTTLYARDDWPGVICPNCLSVIEDASPPTQETAEPSSEEVGA